MNDFDSRENKKRFIRSPFGLCDCIHFTNFPRIHRWKIFVLRCRANIHYNLIPQQTFFPWMKNSLLINNGIFDYVVHAHCSVLTIFYIFFVFRLLSFSPILHPAQKKNKKKYTNFITSSAIVHYKWFLISFNIVWHACTGLFVKNCPRASTCSALDKKM